MHIHNIGQKLVLFIPGVVFLTLWEITVQSDARLMFLFGAPSLIFQVALEEYSKAGIWVDIALTGFETITGLVIGTIFGVTTALLMWSNRTAERLSRPYVTIAGSIPVFALAPMLIIWFGVGVLPKIVLAGLGVFFITLVQTHEGIKSTAREHIEYARIVGASWKMIVCKLLLPSASQWVIAGLRINIGVALLGAFIGEFISSRAGLGHYIIEAGQVYDIPKALFGIVNLSIFALILDSSINHLFSRSRFSIVTNMKT